MNVLAKIGVFLGQAVLVIVGLGCLWLFFFNGLTFYEGVALVVIGIGLGLLRKFLRRKVVR